MASWEKYRSKSDIIEAIQFTGDCIHGLISKNNGSYIIKSPYGDTVVKKSDYIVKTGKGSYETVPASEFEKKYEKVPAKKTGEPDICPCCGSSAAIVKKEQESGKGILFYVRCGNKDCRLRTKNCGSTEEALKIWNNRAN